MLALESILGNKAKHENSGSAAAAPIMPMAIAVRVPSGGR